MFQFHEEIGEDYLGVSERLVVLSYGVLGLIFLAINLGEIFRSEYLILGLVLFLFAMSAFGTAPISKSLVKSAGFSLASWKRSLRMV